MPAEGPKRLNWKWEELVLACDLLMQNNGHSVDHEDPRAIELSQVLRQMTLHPQEDRLPQFRNPNGVAQKTRNLVQHLPGYTGSASRGSTLDREVVERFIAKPEVMHATAESIRKSVAAGEPLVSSPMLPSQLGPADLVVDDGALTPFYITSAELDFAAATRANTRSTASSTSTATPPSSTF